MSGPAPAVTRERDDVHSTTWRQRGLDLYGRLAEVAAGHLGASRAIGYAGGAGRLRHRALGRWPSTRQVRDLFGDHDSIASRDPRATAQAISALEFSNRTLVTLVRRQGLAPLTSLVSPASTDRLLWHRRPHHPTVVIVWHLGVMFGVAAILAQARIPALIIRQSAVYDPIESLELAFTENRADVRAATMWRALTRLRDGGVVLMAADGLDAAQTSPVTCFGRTLTLARGPFSLARLAGASVVPLVARWDGRNIVADVGDPLEPVPHAAGNDSGVETNYAAAAAAWLESYLRATPQTLTLCTLHSLLRARRVALES